MLTQPFTRAETVLRLENDRATLLDLDQGDRVNAVPQPEGHWEVRPVEGPTLLVGVPRSGLTPGFAEAKGLLPLIVPRPGRVASPYALALATRGWSVSASVDSAETRARRSSQLLRWYAFQGTIAVAGGVVVAVANQGSGSAGGFAGLLVGLSVLRLANRWNRDRTHRRINRVGAAVHTRVDLDWRPADNGGCLAWILIDDDSHDRLEAPVVGLPATSIDAFPTTAEVAGELRPGSTIAATLRNGTTLRTIKPLAAARPTQ